MPDFRQTLDQAKFTPELTNISTTGPNAEGAETTWQNPRPQLTQSSAQELANMLGAKLTSVSMGGPYSNDKPQWQLDFGTGDTQDAAMVYENYQKRPGSFNQQLQDEFKTSQGPSVAAAEFAAGQLGGGGHPAGPGGPGGGGGQPYTPPPANVPGPNWPAPAPPNIPGPNWDNIPPVPGPTGTPPVALHPGTGVANPGGYTVPGMPPSPLPPPSLLNTPMRLGGVDNSRTPPAGGRGMYPTIGGLLNPVALPSIPTQTLAGSKASEGVPGGLLGLRHNDGTPFTPEELFDFGRTGKHPDFPLGTVQRPIDNLPGQTYPAVPRP